MSKQTIERKVASIVEKMEGWSYLYDDYRAVNHSLDNQPLPCVVFTLPTSGNIRVGNSQFRDQAQCAIAFAMDAELDADGILRDSSVIEKCKMGAIAFIKLCNESGLFEQITGAQQYDVFVNSFDANLAGITIFPTITELQGVSVCTNVNNILNG